MKRKYVGEVTDRFTVYKHVSSWDGNFRCDIWSLMFQSESKSEAFNFYNSAGAGYFELRDESLISAKVLSATC